MAARLGEAEEKIKVLHSGMTLARVAALKWLGAVWGSGEGVASEAVELGDIDLVCPKIEGSKKRGQKLGWNQMGQIFDSGLH